MFQSPRSRHALRLYTVRDHDSPWTHVDWRGETDDRRSQIADKSSIFLLQRWAEFTCHDPYYTNNMRDWLYRDSPEPIRMFARRNSVSRNSRRNFLLISQDLSLSGAPIMVSHLAKWCKAQEIFVVVMSPVDGPLRETLVEADIPVIIDPLLATGYEAFTKFGRHLPVRSHRSFTRFAREFDCVVASTIFAAPLIRDASTESIPHIWWIHEGLVGNHFLKQIFCPSGRFWTRRTDNHAG